MAKVSSVERNKRIKKTIQRYSKKREELKSIMNDKKAPLGERFKAMVKLSELPRDSSKVRYRNRCSISGRPRGFFRFFGLCRNMFRKLASFGRLPGVKKSSW